MKKHRVYIDTSVFGGCFEPEFEIWSNGLMDDFRKSIFKPVISQILSDEIKDAPLWVREKYAEIFKLNHDFIRVNADVLSLQRKYVERAIIPKKFQNDLLHIALATIAEVDILVSWNFKHIVHFDKIKLFNEVNIRSNYKMLQIFSPREVTTYEKR